MMADHVFKTWQKTIRLDLVPGFFQLHNKGGSQVNQVGITNIGEKRIGKALWVLGPQGIKVGFPEIVNKGPQGFFCLAAVIPVLKMINMEEFYVLHSIGVYNRVKPLVN